MRTLPWLRCCQGLRVPAVPGSRGCEEPGRGRWDRPSPVGGWGTGRALALRAPLLFVPSGVCLAHWPFPSPCSGCALTALTTWDACAAARVRGRRATDGPFPDPWRSRTVHCGRGDSGRQRRLSPRSSSPRAIRSESAGSAQGDVTTSGSQGSSKSVSRFLRVSSLGSPGRGLSVPQSLLAVPQGPQGRAVRVLEAPAGPGKSPEGRTHHTRACAHPAGGKPAPGRMRAARRRSAHCGCSSWLRRGSAALPAGGAVGGLLAFAGEHLKGSLWQHRHSGAGDSGRSFCVAAEGRCQACGRLHPGLVPGVRPAQAAGGRDVLGDVEPGVQGGQQRPDAGRTHLGTLVILPSAGAWSGRFSREKIPGLCAAHGHLGGCRKGGASGRGLLRMGWGLLGMGRGRCPRLEGASSVSAALTQGHKLGFLL